MEEIKLMERLKDYEVPEVCQTIIDVANDFSLEYCFQNDCQHVSSNIGVAAKLRDNSKGLRVEELLEHPSKFSNLRYLLKNVLKERGLKPRGMNPYNQDINPVEFRQYATADEFVNRVA